jgi:HK97 gp10 family phage protein
METGFKFVYDKKIFEKIDDAIRNAAIMALKEATQRAVTRAHMLVRIDTGRLKNSIVGHVIQDRKDEIYGIIGTAVEYAPYQEFGTSKMTGKPYLFPAVNEYSRKLSDYLKANIAKIKVIK